MEAPRSRSWNEMLVAYGPSPFLDLSSEIAELGVTSVMMNRGVESGPNSVERSIPR